MDVDRDIIKETKRDNKSYCQYEDCTKTGVWLKNARNSVGIIKCAV